jgi:hypothetical protein
MPVVAQSPITAVELDLLRGVTSAQVQVDPYPHLVIENALKPEIYEQLSREYPSVEMIRSAKQVYQRDQLMATDIVGNEAIAPIWRQFVEMHISAAFYQKLAALFAPYVRKTYPWLETDMTKRLEDFTCGVRDPKAEKLPDVCLDCQPGLNVVSREPVSYRSAHLDASNKLFTGLFYMKYDEDKTRGGDFVLYRPKNVPPPFDTPTTVPESELEPVKTIPYQKNTAVFFMNSPWSIHGVSVREGTDIPRRLVNLVAGCYTMPRKAFFPSPPAAVDFAATRFA